MELSANRFDDFNAYEMIGVSVCNTGNSTHDGYSDIEQIRAEQGKIWPTLLSVTFVMQTKSERFPDGLWHYDGWHRNPQHDVKYGTRPDYPDKHPNLSDENQWYQLAYDGFMFAKWNTGFGSRLYKSIEYKPVYLKSIRTTFYDKIDDSIRGLVEKEKLTCFHEDPSNPLKVPYGYEISCPSDDDISSTFKNNQCTFNGFYRKAKDGSFVDFFDQIGTEDVRYTTIQNDQDCYVYQLSNEIYDPKPKTRFPIYQELGPEYFQIEIKSYDILKEGTYGKKKGYLANIEFNPKRIRNNLGEKVKLHMSASFEDYADNIKEYDIVVVKQVKNLSVHYIPSDANNSHDYKFTEDDYRVYVIDVGMVKDVESVRISDHITECRKFKTIGCTKGTLDGEEDTNYNAETQIYGNLTDDTEIWLRYECRVVNIGMCNCKDNTLVRTLTAYYNEDATIPADDATLIELGIDLKYEYFIEWRRVDDNMSIPTTPSFTRNTSIYPYRSGFWWLKVQQMCKDINGKLIEDVDLRYQHEDTEYINVLSSHITNVLQKDEYKWEGFTLLIGTETLSPPPYDIKSKTGEVIGTGYRITDTVTITANYMQNEQYHIAVYNGKDTNGLLCNEDGKKITYAGYGTDEDVMIYDIEVKDEIDKTDNIVLDPLIETAIPTHRCTVRKFFDIICN